MRTGAIFARGSCRALKWMALVGVLFALGSGQALAQTVEGAWYNVSGTGVSVVTVKMSASVQASSGADIFGSFTLGTTTGTAGGPTTTASDEFTVTFGTATITGTPTLTYTPSTTAGDPIIEDSGGRDVGGFSQTVMSAVPQIPSAINPPPALIGLDFSFEVPEATGGIGDITYAIADFGTTTANSHTDGELPEGLEFDGDSRMITGKATTAGRFQVTVTATDDASGELTAGTDHESTAEFYIDVSAPPDLTVMVTADPMTIAEGGTSTITATASRMVAAADEPVTIALAVVGEATLSANSITIAAGDQSGTVTLTSTADDDYEPDTVTVTATGTGITGSQNVQIAVTDMAPPEILSVVVSADPTTIAEGGTSTITAMANREVMATDGTVTVNLRVVGEATLSAQSITIAAGAQSGSVTLTSTADDDYEPDTVTVTATGSGVAANHPNVEITVTDMAPPVALTVTVRAAPMRIAEGGTSTITATANRAVMASDGAVTIALSVVPPAGATLSANSITIAAGAMSGTATLTAAEDDDYEDETVTVVASGDGIAGNQNVEITVTDNDQPPAKRRGQITEMTFSGGSRGMRTIGGEQRYHVLEGDTTVKLDVTVQWDHAELTELAALGITTVSIDLMIKGAQPAEQMQLPRWLSWIDDEGDVDFPNTTGELGRLRGRVMVPVPDAPSNFPNSIRHHQANSGSIALLILHDEHEAEEDAFYIDAVSSNDVDLAASDARNTTTPLAVIEDDEDQEVVISGPSRMHEGEVAKTFTIKAEPKRLDLPLEARLSVVDLQGATISGERYSLSDASLVFNPNRDGTGNSLDVELRFPSPDGDREDDNYKLEVAVVDYSLTSGGFDTTVVDDHPIKIVDIHRLPPVTVDAYSSMLMEGDEVTLKLKVDRNPPETPRVDPETNLYTYEALTLTLNGGGMATAGKDYEMPATVAVPEHDGSAPWVQEVELTVKALDDDDVEMEDEDLMVHAIMEGDDPKNGDETRRFDNLVSLTLTDETTKLVSVRANAYEVIKQALGDPPMLTTGMSADLMGSNLFDYDPNAVEISYGTPETTDRSVVSPSASGGTITLTAVSAGEAKITITATAEPKSSSLVVNQTKANVAQLTFPVMVEDEDLVFMVSGPDDIDDMNLAEGGMGGMVTVTTNRPVTENTEVMLMRDGSSSASEDDYTLEPPLVTIMAGHEMGSTMVMATEDGMSEDMEMLTLFLVVDGMQMTDKSVSFYLWDAAVPALPVIAQLLLAAFLAVGGYRRYRRR